MRYTFTFQTTFAVSGGTLVAQLRASSEVKCDALIPSEILVTPASQMFTVYTSHIND